MSDSFVMAFKYKILVSKFVTVFKHKILVPEFVMVFKYKILVSEKTKIRSVDAWRDSLLQFARKRLKC